MDNLAPSAKVAESFAIELAVFQNVSRYGNVVADDEGVTSAVVPTGRQEHEAERYILFWPPELRLQ